MNIYSEIIKWYNTQYTNSKNKLIIQFHKEFFIRQQQKREKLIDNALCIMNKQTSKTKLQIRGCKKGPQIYMCAKKRLNIYAQQNYELPFNKRRSSVRGGFALSDSSW